MFLSISQTSLAADAPAVYANFNLGADPHGAKAQAQGLRVMEFVNKCVHSIDNMAIVQAKIDALAQRHISYNVKKSDFAVSRFNPYACMYLCMLSVRLVPHRM